jgi:hypothetical protein
MPQGFAERGRGTGFAWTGTGFAGTGMGFAERARGSRVLICRGWRRAAALGGAGGADLGVYCGAGAVGGLDWAGDWSGGHN